MRRHFIGRVYIFDDAPQEDFDFVDIPAFTQGEETSLALLAQIDNVDLTPMSESRLSGIRAQKELSFETIRANAGIDPVAQVALARRIRQNARTFHGLLSWTGYPSPDQLKLTCELIFSGFVGKRRDGISTGSQLAYRLSRFRAIGGDIKKFIEEILERDKVVDGDPDKAVLTALEFQRSWAMFRLPRLLLALERIQGEVFRRLGFRPGNYGKYVADIENGFVGAELVSLDEYGLPIQIGQRLAHFLRLGGGLDVAIASLKRLDSEAVGLSMYERSVIKRVQAGL